MSIYIIYEIEHWCSLFFVVLIMTKYVYFCYKHKSLYRRQHVQLRAITKGLRKKIINDETKNPRKGMRVHEDSCKGF